MYILTRDPNGNFNCFSATDEQWVWYQTADVDDHLAAYPITCAADLTAEARLTLVDGAKAFTQISGNELKKFKTKDQLEERLFGAIAANADDFPHDMNAVDIGTPSNPDPVPAPKKRKVASGRRKGFHTHAPKDKAYPARVGTKQAHLIDALARPEGASLDDLRAATSKANGGKDWQDASIFSAFGEDICSKKGYGVRTEEVDGAPRYFLVLPKGLDAPLPHTPRKS